MKQGTTDGCLCSDVYHCDVTVITWIILFLLFLVVHFLIGYIYYAPPMTGAHVPHVRYSDFLLYTLIIHFYQQQNNNQHNQQPTPPPTANTEHQ